MFQKEFFLFSIIFFLLLSVPLVTDAETKSTVNVTSLYSSPGDGGVVNFRVFSNWPDCHNINNGTELRNKYIGAWNAQVAQERDGTYQIIRTFLPFDTVAIPENAVITNAKLYFYVAKVEGNGTFHAVQASQLSTSTLDFSDFSNINNISLGSTDTDSITIGGYNYIELNNLSVINKGGYTKLGLREGQDINDSPPAVGTNNAIWMYFSEYDEGRTEDKRGPYLEITYEVEEPVMKYPVIVVPGILGSTHVVGTDKYLMDPILGTYDSLVATIGYNGYEHDKDLFTFPYEWRQSNLVTAEQLKDKIEEVKGISGKAKVDIVAHSMGGLVTRAYIESGEYGNDVDKVVFLGTPHKGSPEAYLTWEGAGGPNTLKDKVMRQIFKLEAHANGYRSLYDYINERVLSVGQLLPDYPYLADQGGTMLAYDPIAEPDNYPYNGLLQILNSEIGLNRLKNAGIDIFNITGNTGDATIGQINVNTHHNMSPLWPHGMATSFDTTIGDGTVPKISSMALGSGYETLEIADAGHGDLPKIAQKQVVTYLTGNTDPDEPVFTSSPDHMIYVGVYSPVDFEIINKNGEKLGINHETGIEVNEINGAYYTGLGSEPEFATIPDPVPGEYRIILKGTGNGEYKLSVSALDDSDSENPENLLPGVISVGDREEVRFVYGDGDNIELEKEADFTSIIKDLDELETSGGIKFEWIKNLLSNRFKHLENKYADLQAAKDDLHLKILRRYISGNLELIEKELGFYKSIGWMTEEAYDVMMADVEGIQSLL